MKTISTKNQKVISFVPLANMFTVFICWYNLLTLKEQWTTFLKSVLICYVCGLPVVVLFLLGCHIAPELESFFTVLAGYLTPVAYSLGLIHLQKTLLL